MTERINQLRYKEIINVKDGARLGYVEDIAVDLASGTVESLIVPGRSRFLWLFGYGEEYIIPWRSVQKIGDDIILTDFEVPPPAVKRSNGFFAKFFK